MEGANRRVNFILVHITLNQKKARLAKDEEDITSRKNPHLTSGIYPTASKLAGLIMMADNKIQKEDTKKETSNKMAARKVCLQ